MFFFQALILMAILFWLPADLYPLMAVTTSARQSVDCLAGDPLILLPPLFLAFFLLPIFLLPAPLCFFPFPLPAPLCFFPFPFLLLLGSAFLASLWSVPSERDSWDSSSFCSRPETRTRAKAPRIMTAFILL